MDYQEFSEYQHNQLPFGDPALTADEFFYFEHNEAYRDDLLATANFYVETFAHNAAYLDIPAGLAFGHDVAINAKAAVHQGKGLIIWNAGLLIKQIQAKEKEADIQQAIAGSQLEPVLVAIDKLPSTLFFQSLQHFTFYHEFAHLIQLQHREESQSMTLAIVAEYNPSKHLLELNADEFAALALSSHIEQYTAGQFGNITKENLSSMLSLFLVPILTQSISIYPEDLTDFNLQKGVHPHPLVRLLHLAIAMMHVLDERHANEFKLNPKQILSQTLEVASKLTDLNLETLWIENLPAIMEYFEAAKNSSFPEGYIDPIDRWNVEIQQRENPE